MLRSKWFTACGAWLVVVACHPAAPATPTPADSSGGVTPAGSGHSRAVLTGDDLVATQKDNVYDAIRILRPNWLRAKVGGVPAVIVNGAEPVDGFQALVRLRVGDVAEVRYYSIVEGRMMFGTVHNGGVLSLKLR